MAYTTINKYTDYFNTKLYTGTGSNGNAITGLGFQPDFIWIKDRVEGYSHRWYDSVRGVNSALNSDNTAAASQYAAYGQLQSIDSDGFTVGQGTSNGAAMNESGDGHVAWCWKAGTTSGINTTGADITPSSYSMNATSGISIIKFTGNGVDGAKIAHGLGAVPEMIISKRLNNSNYWAVYHKTDNTDYLVLNTADAQSDAPIWKDSDPTSIYYQTDNSTSVNPSSEPVVAYFFRSIPGFSKVDSYIGNGNADGPFIFTGFKPQFIFVKNFSSEQAWYLLDTKRDPFNPLRTYLSANNPTEDQDHVFFDSYSNGFKARNTVSGYNTDGNKYIYYAIGTTLVGTNNIPCTAR